MLTMILLNLIAIHASVMTLAITLNNTGGTNATANIRYQRPAVVNITATVSARPQAKSRSSDTASASSAVSGLLPPRLAVSPSAHVRALQPLMPAWPSPSVKPNPSAPVKPSPMAPVKPSPMAPVKPSPVAPVKPSPVAPIKPILPPSYSTSPTTKPPVRPSLPTSRPSQPPNPSIKAAPLERPRLRTETAVWPVITFILTCFALAGSVLACRNSNRWTALRPNRRSFMDLQNDHKSSPLITAAIGNQTRYRSDSLNGFSLNSDRPQYPIRRSSSSNHVAESPV